MPEPVRLGDGRPVAQGGEEDEDVEDLVRAADQVEPAGREALGAALGVPVRDEGGGGGQRESAVDLAREEVQLEMSHDLRSNLEQAASRSSPSPWHFRKDDRGDSQKGADDVERAAEREPEERDPS